MVYNVLNQSRIDTHSVGPDIMPSKQSRVQNEKSVQQIPRASPLMLSVISDILREYQQTTALELKLIDVYLVYVFITGVIQFLYCCSVGTFPFNAFLAGFISTVASFVLAVCLRMHSNPQNADVFPDYMPEWAFGNFIFAHVVLHLAVFNFMG
ncbi:Dolichyl-diphosphooligosaccharide--protein glycosyltransferase subunit DAD1 [Echinococcus granulosus]|nr:Dolichyl-diphosphooligosaccharide--protein glycosyltransferase subunit DAD1 [Echinococcus granulosus]